MKKLVIFLAAILMMATLAGCSSSQSSLQDGYYTAIASEYSHGWKEFVTITVKNGEIVTVEYNAENESGFIKSWDNAYMKNMSAVQGTYPNEYTRTYAARLLESQDPSGVDAIAGATTSWNSFKKLAAAVIEQARVGDSQIVVVDVG